MARGERNRHEGDCGEADPDFRRGTPDLPPLALRHASARLRHRGAEDCVARREIARRKAMPSSGRQSGPSQTLLRQAGLA
jgi:hypothetical protein